MDVLLETQEKIKAAVLEKQRAATPRKRDQKPSCSYVSRDKKVPDTFS